MLLNDVPTAPVVYSLIIALVSLLSNASTVNSNNRSFDSLWFACLNTCISGLALTYEKLASSARPQTNYGPTSAKNCLRKVRTKRCLAEANSCLFKRHDYVTTITNISVAKSCRCCCCPQGAIRLPQSFLLIIIECATHDLVPMPHKQDLSRQTAATTTHIYTFSAA